MLDFNSFSKNDSKIETKKLSFDEFLTSIKNSMINDFSNTEKQALEFTILYKDILKDAWENEYTTREAIACTKRPGMMFKKEVVKESYLFNIDNLYEKYFENIKKEKNSVNIKSYVDEYFNLFRFYSFSDKRIMERIKNNYKRLKKLANKKLLESVYTKDDIQYEVDVLEQNDEIINKIINEFSFKYKKRKERYLRPIKISGKTMYKDIDLQIFLSNKDNIRIKYNDIKDTDELIVYINDNLIYHMDYINNIDIIEKSEKLYRKYLETKGIITIKKINPFE